MNIWGTMFPGLDSVFLPLRHAGTAEIQRINKSVKLAGIEKPMTDVSSENIPVFIVIKKVKKSDPPSISEGLLFLSTCSSLCL